MNDLALSLGSWRWSRGGRGLLAVTPSAASWQPHRTHSPQVWWDRRMPGVERCCWRLINVFDKTSIFLFFFHPHSEPHAAVSPDTFRHIRYLYLLISEIKITSWSERRQLLPLLRWSLHCSTSYGTCWKQQHCSLKTDFRVWIVCWQVEISVRKQSWTFHSFWFLCLLWRHVSDVLSQHGSFSSHLHEELALLFSGVFRSLLLQTGCETDSLVSLMTVRSSRVPVCSRSVTLQPAVSC